MSKSSVFHGAHSRLITFQFIGVHSCFLSADLLKASSVLDGRGKVSPKSWERVPQVFKEVECMAFKEIALALIQAAILPALALKLSIL